MSSVEKKLCKWDKEKIRSNFQDFSRAVGGADHACVKCGRAAVSRKALCKPEKLDPPPPSGGGRAAD